MMYPLTHLKISMGYGYTNNTAEWMVWNWLNIEHSMWKKREASKFIGNEIKLVYVFVFFLHWEKWIKYVSKSFYKNWTVTLIWHYQTLIIYLIYIMFFLPIIHISLKIYYYSKIPIHERILLQWHFLTLTTGNFT